MVWIDCSKGCKDDVRADGADHTRAMSASKTTPATFSSLTGRSIGGSLLGHRFGSKFGYASTLRMRNCLRTTFAEVKNLCKVRKNVELEYEYMRTKRQASTGPSITLNGMLIAEIT